MIKYFCDNCGEELEGVNVYTGFLSGTMKETQFCKECFELNNKASKEIDELFSDMKKDMEEEFMGRRNKILEKYKLVN